MIESVGEKPFAELPEALVEEMLKQCGDLVGSLSDSFQRILERRNRIRNTLTRRGLLVKDREISSTPAYPTTCGVDGSIATEKLISTDMIAIAGLAVEGLTPPTEVRFWPRPHHLSKILSTSHSDSTYVVARAIMMCMELELAAKAPHAVVFLDGSLTTPFIYFNQALNKREEAPKELSSILDNMIHTAFESYQKILLSSRSDKLFVGVPKYTTRKEIAQGILGIHGYEDRGVLSFILDAGEFVGPVKISPPQTKWHIDQPPENSREVVEGIISELESIHIVYYRPYYHLPALRIEIPHSIVTNTQRLAILFEALGLQCGVPGIMEPYPLYLADRMVKHLSTALPAIRRTSTQEMAFRWPSMPGDIYLAMHGYRTEWRK
jgi:hypothetical protein